MGRRRPERIALVLATVTIAAGAIAACVRVADGIADSRVEFRGELDTGEVLRTFHPTGPDGLGDPLPQIRRLGYGYMSGGDAVMTVPEPTSGTVALWALAQLAPWLLAAFVLVLLVPILRAAERDDPFRARATHRLALIGLLLLIGIPAINLLDYLAADSASAGNTVSPTVEPSLTLTLADLLPGVVALVLAGVFARGAELRDLERHTI